MIEDSDLEKIKQVIDMKVSELKVEEKPKETKIENEDSYTVDQIYNHQKSCNNPDCPACKAMTEKVQGQKIQGLMDRTNKLIEKKKFSEKGFSSKIENIIKDIKFKSSNLLDLYQSGE